MDDDIENDNPFVYLFPSIDDAREFRDEIYRNRDVLFAPTEKSKSSNSRKVSPSTSRQTAQSKEKEEEIINYIIENIFLLTVNKAVSDKTKSHNRPSRCVYVRDLHDLMQGRLFLDLEVLEEAVFERLMLKDPAQLVIATREGGKSRDATREAGESLNLRYLYMCFFRSVHEQTKTNTDDDATIKQCQQTILTYTRMVLCHPDIYEGHATSQQFLDLFVEFYSDSVHHDQFLKFLTRVFKDIEEANKSGEEEVFLSETCYPILDILYEKYKSYSIADSSIFNQFPIVQFFASVPALAKVLLDHSTPRSVTLGRAYEATLLGTILSLSCLPRSDIGPFEFFERPSQTSQQEHNIMERNLWVPLYNMNEKRYELFNTLLRVSIDIRHQFLTWLGSCCHNNSGRAKLWTHIQTVVSTEVCDSFMLNLGNVMLRLSQSFAESKSPKLLKIDPTYCAAIVSTDDDARLRGIYLRDLHRETCLVSPPEGVMRPTAANYNFISICFFLTHRVLNLGFNAVIEKFVRLNQDLVRVQRLYEDALAEAGDQSETVQNLKNSMERGMSQFLSYKAALLEPHALEQLISFYSATATWLTHIATCTELDQFQAVQFPLPPTIPLYLSCIPEFIIDSIAEFTIFLRRFSPRTLEFSGQLEHFMTLILVFMGSAERIKNPHLRARLAEMLDALMPHQDNRSQSLISLFHREKLFTEHPFIQELVPTLLNVFVSIEMTGQNVAFEQKFNYRQPMYVVMDYIWKIELHREVFKKLADDAEQNMESFNPPLFLRFINLLINDAIFLLDEALQYMTRLRDQQQLRDNGGLRSLPPDQRQQNESNFHHMGVLARFHNVMGNSTIHILELLTQEIKSIFTHRTIVDRIAAMLNYFLLHLVGPKKKQLKVKDLAEYEFKPQELVRDICIIYLHLGESKQFCQAVSRDGRSYSGGLFIQAEQVLLKIGQSALVDELQEVAARIAELAIRQQAEDEVLSEAPEEFLDPIMGTLMNDPVILPSSKVTVDRSTIARHLLSDQTDPFNRSPLTMDMVEPDTLAKKRIQDWINSLKQNLQSTSDS